MAYDLEAFSDEPIKFDVEFQGKTLTHHVKAVSLDDFFASMKGSTNPTANMRRTFRELLLDEDQQPLSKDWIEKLLTRPALIPLGLKINAAINSALGLDELAAKKG